MVTITMDQVMEFRNNADFFGNTSIPLKGAYKINKIRQALDKESEFYSNKFQGIIDQYAKKDDDGNVVFSDDGEQIMIQEESLIECNNALKDLQELEVEIDNCNLTLEDLGEDLECTPDQLNALMPFFN